MDAISLQEKIIGNKDSILTIIESLGYKNIRFHGNYFTFPRLDGDNQSANVIYTDTLRWTCYTRNESGNIFTLVMITKHKNFPESIKYIAKVIGITENNITKVKYPFSGFYKKLEKATSYYGKDYIYSDNILKKYNGVSQKFFEDGVAFDIQNKFEVAFSHEDDSIAIPIRNLYGQLIGVKMRNNNPNCEHDKRFWSAYSYSKTRVVYGLWQNYQHIISKNTVIIFESEKAVMQAASCGINIAVGIGGHDISKYQVRLLKGLMIKKIILAFDEGLDEYEIIDQCKKFISANKIYNAQIYYIYDAKNVILKRNSKDSPIDHGKTVFQNLLHNCLIKYGGEENA